MVCTAQLTISTVVVLGIQDQYVISHNKILYYYDTYHEDIILVKKNHIYLINSWPWVGDGAGDEKYIFSLLLAFTCMIFIC